MPIATQCTHCGKGYQVAESTLGKQVKCQACGKVFVVAAARAASHPPKAGVATTGRAASLGRAAAGSRPTPADPGRTVTATAAPPTSREAADRAALAKLETQFGLQPLPANPNRVFPAAEYRRPSGAPDPLANHIVTDPGFEQVSEAEYAAYQDDLVRQEKQAKMDYLANLSDDDELVTKSDIKLPWLYVVAIIQLLGAVLGAPLATISVMLGAVVFALPTFVSMIAPTIDIFLVLNRHGRLKEVLYLFIPFYNIFYYFSNFKMFMHHFFGSLAINVAFWVSLFLFGLLAELMGARIPPAFPGN